MQSGAKRNRLRLLKRKRDDLEGDGTADIVSVTIPESPPREDFGRVCDDEKTLPEIHGVARSVVARNDSSGIAGRCPRQRDRQSAARPFALPPRGRWMFDDNADMAESTAPRSAARPCSGCQARPPAPQRHSSAHQPRTPSPVTATKKTAAEKNAKKTFADLAHILLSFGNTPRARHPTDGGVSRLARPDRVPFAVPMPPAPKPSGLRPFPASTQLSSRVLEFFDRRTTADTGGGASPGVACASARRPDPAQAATRLAASALLERVTLAAAQRRGRPRSFAPTDTGVGVKRKSEHGSRNSPERKLPRLQTDASGRSSERQLVEQKPRESACVGAGQSSRTASSHGTEPPPSTPGAQRSFASAPLLAKPVRAPVACRSLTSSESEPTAAAVRAVAPQLSDHRQQEVVMGGWVPKGWNHGHSSAHSPPGSRSELPEARSVASGTSNARGALVARSSDRHTNAGGGHPSAPTHHTAKYSFSKSKRPVDNRPLPTSLQSPAPSAVDRSRSSSVRTNSTTAAGSQHPLSGQRNDGAGGGGRDGQGTVTRQPSLLPASAPTSVSLHTNPTHPPATSPRPHQAAKAPTPVTRSYSFARSDSACSHAASAHVHAVSSTNRTKTSVPTAGSHHRPQAAVATATLPRHRAAGPPPVAVAMSSVETEFDDDGGLDDATMAAAMAAVDEGFPADACPQSKTATNGFPSSSSSRPRSAIGLAGRADCQPSYTRASNPSGTSARRGVAVPRQPGLAVAASRYAVATPTTGGAAARRPTAAPSNPGGTPMATPRLAGESRTAPRTGTNALRRDSITSMSQHQQNVVAGARHSSSQPRMTVPQSASSAGQRRPAPRRELISSCPMCAVHFNNWESEQYRSNHIAECCGGIDDTF